MRKVYVILVVMLLAVTVSAYANGNTNHQSNHQAQGQLQGQLQGQQQGQIANGQVDQNVEQGNAQDVNVAGDETKTKVYANAWPALSGGEGVSQANAYSIFGGLGLSNTEKYKVYITQIQAVEASVSLSQE